MNVANRSEASLILKDVPRLSFGVHMSPFPGRSMHA